MMAITTRSSTSVNARREGRERMDMGVPSEGK
jgi:hypothetical protein